MNLFRLDASVRVEDSHSRQIADIVEREWTTAHPEETVTRREVGIDPLPSTAWSNAAFAGFVPKEQRSDEQQEAVGLATTIVDELIAADAMLFAVPLYNYGVSQHFKTWVDLAITDSRMSGDKPAVAGTPAVLATVRGGYYADGTPREGWDHATPWMRRILEDVWQLDLLVVEASFTLIGVDPGLDQFADLAQNLRSAAEQKAVEHGRELAGRMG